MNGSLCEHEVTELGDWQQCSVELMEAGLLPKGWCNTTGTHVQTTQHIRHTYAFGSWSANVLQKTSSNWTWVQTKRLLEKKTESAVAFQCVWMCIRYLNTLKTLIPEVFGALWVCIFKIHAALLKPQILCNNQKQANHNRLFIPNNSDKSC